VLREFGEAGYPCASTELSIRPRKRYDPNGYYKLFGVEPWASTDEIKAAYHRLAKEHHPDLGGDNDFFQLITQIYGVLSNPLLRREYDETPDECIYLGSIEIQELRRRLPDLNDRGVDPKPDLVRDVRYSFRASSDVRELAEKWYSVLLPAYRLYGVSGTVVLSLEEISEPSARIEGLMEVLSLPEWLEPNFFTAFYIINTLLIKRYGE